MTHAPCPSMVMVGIYLDRPAHNRIGDRHLETDKEIDDRNFCR